MTVPRSKEIDEIIGRPPHWLIQWGITLFFVILVVIITLSYFIEYPETIKGKFTLISNNPPVVISVDADGIITKIWVSEDVQVHKGDTLFYWKKNGDSQILSVISPSEGTVDLSAPLYGGQKLKKDSPLFLISPKPTSFYAVIYVKANDIKKLTVGEKAHLYFSNYPKGSLDDVNGQIRYISNVQTVQGYYVKIELPKGFNKNLEKKKQFIGGSPGITEIVIRKQKLINKFLNNIHNN